ncbi:hypothetical protein GW17_00023072 [Ensete ventricosum]|nr:hypothetical protein GW17_00023072 [Ensete ventricosum]
MACRLNGIVDCGKRHMHIHERAMLLVEQVKVSQGSPLVTCLLEGPSGRLLEYVAVGPRFSNSISQTLLVLLKRLPPKNMLVIGTTSEVGFLESLGICDAFSVTYHVPRLNRDDAKKVLQGLSVFTEDDLDSAVEELNDVS